LTTLATTSALLQLDPQVRTNIDGPGNLTLCAMSCHRVQVGNALEGAQWSGSTQRLLRLGDEHVVSELRL
jgi:hypothetical protein